MINTILIFSSLVVFAVVILILYIRAKNKVETIKTDDFSSIDKVTEAVKYYMVEYTKEDYSLGLSEAEFNRLYKRKARVESALKNCVYGRESAKAIVKGLIADFINENVSNERVSELLGLDESGEPSEQVKFEIIMHMYKKRYGKKALEKWIEKYHLGDNRIASDADTVQDKAYYVTEEDLDIAYDNEGYQYNLSIEDQIDILATVVYQRYKGFGILDTINEMDINGYNCGTSGSILVNNKNGENDLRASKSVWIYYKGRYIHFRFLDFGTEDELRRIIQLIIRYGNPGPLTSKRGYMVNTMENKSRVLALRPPASEYWAVFVRKFTLDNNTIEYLLDKPTIHRADLPMRLIEYLMKGHVTCAVTGRQGSGKTTLMKAMMKFIDRRYTIRVLEMAPELYLRELYPTRNILSVQETNTVSATELQDALKKSDAAVSIVGEVATDSIAARMIQMGMTASIFTIFSHHANTPKDLVLTLRNSLVNDGGFSNMDTAEKQVTDVVRVDIHLDYGPDGERYVERISEIVQLEQNMPYPEYDPNDPVNSMNKITREYYQRSTDRIAFYTHDILKFNTETNTYETCDRLSEKLESSVRSNLGKEIVDNFDEFMLSNWQDREEVDLKEQAIKMEEQEKRAIELEELRAKIEERESKESLELKSVALEALSEEEIQKMWRDGYNEDESDEFGIGLFDEE